MKSRRVILTVEVESNETIKTLKEDLECNLNLEENDMDGYRMTRVIQIQANVVKPDK